ncbi:TetR/AcrR family transcriptional regulator [Serinibacter salmoneus]|uniref:TetR family transcriptional regulator n=1 Tax=Serinibacter salmoneus TaxID=556530 RepID=A0A2A9CY99_9MICO|nr:TetR/AcrR family transcriptional regulator [Serinibacter salmoneus]PFG19407.1 TetR family transcriptional regulator [Serinibacter salmoneus]
MARTPARERLLRAAAELFYENGMTATGIDAVTARAGVARMSLYNNFASKDALVLAYLAERHEEWLALYRERLATARGPREGVLAVVDAYLDHAHLPQAAGSPYRGCGLLNAAAELGPQDPGREAVRTHKEEVEAILCGHLAEDLAPARAAEVAEHIAFLLEGATTRAGLEGDSARLRRARTLIAAILDNELGPTDAARAESARA